MVSQRWENLLFAHWRADPGTLRRHLPSGVEPDLADGSAWLGIVAFVMVGTRAGFGPRWRGLAPIPELNVRTYVRVDGVPGVWFLSLDAASSFFAAAGRMLYGLRYRRARMVAAIEGERIHYLSVGKSAAFVAAYQPCGPATLALPGSIEHFLVERYRLFAERRGRLITAEVMHEPWPLQPAAAQIELNRMAPPGLPLEGVPLVHFCRSVSALISAPQLVARSPRISREAPRLPGFEAWRPLISGRTSSRRPSRRTVRRGI